MVACSNESEQRRIPCALSLAGSATRRINYMYMKPLFLALFVALFFTARADAASEFIQITPHDPGQDFHIKSEKTGGGVRFIVTIDNSALISPEFGVSLSVIDGNDKFIESRNIVKK